MSARFLLQHYVRDAAGLAPEATAVRHDGRGIRYDELEERSNRIARALAAAGTTRGDRVVVHAPKSIPVVETIYGVMKAGAAYVPVEPGTPAPRLAEIVGQCRPRGVVTWSGARSKLDPELLRRSGVDFVWSLDEAESFTDLPVRVLDAATAAAAEEPEPPAAGAVETDLAYVLFTSGSTGSPKGVMLSHRNALTFVDWVVDTFELSADRSPLESRTLQLRPLGPRSLRCGGCRRLGDSHARGSGDVPGQARGAHGAGAAHRLVLRSLGARPPRIARRPHPAEPAPASLDPLRWRGLSGQVSPRADGRDSDCPGTRTCTARPRRTW